MRDSEESQPRTLREAFDDLTVDGLKPLVALVGAVPTKKGQLVDQLTGTLGDPSKLRKLYNDLDDLGRNALQEATYDPNGALDLFKFKAKYNRTPGFGGSGRRYADQEKPTILRLFFPLRNRLARDLQTMLREFVPKPPAMTVKTLDDLPLKVTGPRVPGGSYHRKQDVEELELRTRQTDRTALQDVKALLRLIDLGEVRVSEKSRRPTPATMKVIGGVLAEADFYTEADQSEDDWSPAADLCIQAFAWPMLLQAAGFAELAGTRLQLTAAGRKAMTKPSHELIRHIWEKWRKTKLLDEFNRIDVIKGQQAKGRGLTAVAPRREAIEDVLCECPAQKWIAIGELFRLLKASALDFEVSHDTWKLYISEQRYGSLGYDGASWEMLQGRYTLALLFEYAATLGLLDVACLPPEGVRNDYGGSWGTDDLSCLSRYDRMMYLRINSLGAWCLGLSENYEPALVPAGPFLRVLPNRDVVAADRPIAPADALFLERFAERTSEVVWRLDAGKILEAVGKGLTVEELKGFMEAKNQGPLPQTVKVFLDDLAHKLGQLEDLGTARLIACKDTNVAQLIVHDRRLRNLCQSVGERQIVFRSADESTIRRVLKELGYVLPPPR
jgi:Helicase conserved C-terminal domain